MQSFKLPYKNSRKVQTWEIRRILKLAPWVYISLIEVVGTNVFLVFIKSMFLKLYSIKISVHIEGDKMQSQLCPRNAVGTSYSSGVIMSRTVVLIFPLKVIVTLLLQQSPDSWKIARATQNKTNKKLLQCVEYHYLVETIYHQHPSIFYLIQAPILVRFHNQSAVLRC
jgi:hypothetical protein